MSKFRGAVAFANKTKSISLYKIPTIIHCIRVNHVCNMVMTDVATTLITETLPCEVSKGAKIRNRYNQLPHLTQDTNGKVINSQLDSTNESQEVSPSPAGDHKAHINRRAQRHSKHKTDQKHKRSTKEVPPWNGQ